VVYYWPQYERFEARVPVSASNVLNDILAVWVARHGSAVRWRGVACWIIKDDACIQVALHDPQAVTCLRSQICELTTSQTNAGRPRRQQRQQQGCFKPEVKVRVSHPTHPHTVSPIGLTKTLQGTRLVCGVDSSSKRGVGFLPHWQLW
jgi:hypothetical protein